MGRNFKLFGAWVALKHSDEHDPSDCHSGFTPAADPHSPWSSFNMGELACAGHRPRDAAPSCEISINGDAPRIGHVVPHHKGPCSLLTVRRLPSSSLEIVN